MSNVIAGIEATIREVFSDPDIRLTPASYAADVDGWDSLMHLNVVIALEQRFGLRFTTAEISKMKEEGQTIGHLADMIGRKTGTQGLTLRV